MRRKVPMFSHCSSRAAASIGRDETRRDETSGGENATGVIYSFVYSRVERVSARSGERNASECIECRLS